MKHPKSDIKELIQAYSTTYWYFRKLVIKLELKALEEKDYKQAHEYEDVLNEIYEIYNDVMAKNWI